MVLALVENRANRDCDGGAGEFSTGKAGTGGFSTSCSSRGVLIPKIDIDDRNILLYVAEGCGVFSHSVRKPGMFVFVWVLLYQARLLVEHVGCVYRISRPMTNEWSVLLAMQVHFRRRER